MQTCQGHIIFVGTKLDAGAAKYPTADVTKVREGLAGYDQYIQAKIVSPGLLKFAGGDKAKADHALSINECAKQAAPAGQALEDLKVALHTMLKLAKLK